MNKVIISILILFLLPKVMADRIDIVFDYRYDREGFFDEDARRTLEHAAEWLENRIDDHWPEVDVIRGDLSELRYQYVNPETGRVVTRASGSQGHPANKLIVYVGGYRSYPEHWGASNAGSVAVAIFGQLLGTAVPEDRNNRDLYVPTVGSIAFDGNLHWYFDNDPTTNEVGASNSVLIDGVWHRDFFHVAVHELTHLLGFGSDRYYELVASYDRGSAAYIDMPHTMNENGGVAPIFWESHFFNIEPINERMRTRAWNGKGWEEGVFPIMSQSGGSRYPTELDFAVLRDLGVGVVPIDLDDGVRPDPDVDDEPKGYSLWLEINELAGRDADVAADPDRDGIMNLTSYALGIAPGDGYGDPKVVQQEEGSLLFWLPSEIPEDVTYVIQCSRDLINWEDGAVKVGREPWSGRAAEHLTVDGRRIVVPADMANLESAGCTYTRLVFKLVENSKIN